MKNILTFACGLLFGLGLIVSGMANPAKVQNFLDVFGTWDPSLVFVMGGAILVTMPGYWFIRRRTAPLFADSFQFPTRNDLDTRLIAGAATFGVGWGMSGYCPGPAVTAVSVGNSSTLVFVLAMLIGMSLAKIVQTPVQQSAAV